MDFSTSSEKSEFGGLKARGFFVSLFLKPGCQARGLFHSKTTWEVAVDRFNDYITELNTRADNMMTGIRSSQISRELE